MIALEMLIQQYAKSNGRRQSMLRDQMKLVGFHLPKLKKRKPLSVDEFRNLVHVIDNPVSIKLTDKNTSSISISSIIKEFMIDYRKEFDIEDVSIDFKADQLLQFSKIGFDGFFKIGHIGQQLDTIPNTPGVYIVFNFSSQQLNISNHSIIENSEYYMKNKWVRDAKIIYIGKTTDQEKTNTLRNFLTKLTYETINHPLIDDIMLLQSIPRYEELLICWKEATNESANQLHKKLIDEFKNNYGKLPFANK